MGRLALAAFVIWPVLGSAEPVQLTAPEISALLTGNTAVGQWADDTYRQHFDADGSTIYAVKGKRSSRGEWRVNTATDEYESWWPRSGWAGYSIERDGDVLEWVTSTGTRYAFTMEAGQNLLWSD